ncbi:unnamed protein product, partial [Polarella glacialis]
PAEVQGFHANVVLHLTPKVIRRRPRYTCGGPLILRPLPADMLSLPSAGLAGLHQAQVDGVLGGEALQIVEAHSPSEDRSNSSLTPGNVEPSSSSSLPEQLFKFSLPEAPNASGQTRAVQPIVPEICGVCHLRRGLQGSCPTCGTTGSIYEIRRVPCGSLKMGGTIHL